ncbi:MAG TPA: DEAD/DEAH box helicase [Thiolinea sp.]|nr:DEAD/DEAH box helicase [Thiolinea sp.]
MSTTPQDLFLFDNEQLRALSNEEAVRQGLAWYKENRVIFLQLEQQHLLASVEAPDREDPYQSTLHHDDAGVLRITCDCGATEAQACYHVIAALFAHAARQGEEALSGATETALENRIKRGRTEVEAEPLTPEGIYGPWKVSSITTDTFFPHTYRVNIRSLEQRHNYCTCPDFATNQLGTCKHIEGVLHRLRKRTDFAALLRAGAPDPFIYLNWDSEQPPTICLQRSPRMDAALARLLEPYFDAGGHFSGQLPEDFFRLAEQLQDRSDIDVGADATAHVRRLATRASRQLRAQEVRARIEAANGHLPGVKARLYPYQSQGVAFLAANGRALLADDMGLGKTLQAIAAATWLYQHAQARRILVVCPASLKQQWAREITKFTELPVQVVEGSPQGRTVQYRRGDGFHILNYELVLRDLSLINNTLIPDLLILDEAQRIKNWQTKIATAVKRIEASHAFVLSGTPLENRLEDLYSLMQVVDPHVLGPLWRYYADFHITDERGKVLGYRNLSLLRQRLAPVMLRRDRRLVRDQLPGRIEQRLDLALTQAQRELHDTAMQAAGTLARKARHRPLTPGESRRLMAALQQARMACDAAGLVDKESTGSPKLDELENIVAELCVQSGLKMVVFSQWELMTQMVEARLLRMGVGCVRLHGKVPTRKRGELMDRFQEDDAIQVFISTDAGGTGLNLQNAAVLVNLDIPWNPAVLDQRIARIHRLGQKQHVQIILMVATDSYEEHVMSLVRGKRHLFDNVIDPEGDEDVVGVNRKLLETVTADLGTLVAEAGSDAAGAPPAITPETEAAETADADRDTDPIPPGGAAQPDTADPALEQQLHRTILGLQQHFGLRIERMLGSNGGLLVVLDQVTEQDDERLEQMETALPVALMDPRSLQRLQKLGAASPLHDARELELPEPDSLPPNARLLQLAREKLQAAEVLLEQGLHHITADMLVSACLQAATYKAGQETPPSDREAALWLYGEALPNGWLDADTVALVSRTLALARTQNLPALMLEGLLEDMRRFVE